MDLLNIIFDFQRDNTIYLDLVSNLVVTHMEVICFYFMYCELVQKKMRLTKKIVLYIVLIGGVMGISVTFMNISFFKLILYTSVFFIIRKIDKAKTEDVYILFIIIFAFIFGLQMFASFVILLTNIDINIWFINIAIEAVVAFLILIICKNCLVCTMYNKIKRSLPLKGLFFVLNIMGFGFAFWINFDIHNLKPHLLSYLFFIAISIYCYYATGVETKFYSEEMPMKHHDVQNVLTGLKLLINQSNDEEMIHKSEGYFNKLNIRLKSEMVYDGKEHNIIHEFIKEKELSKAVEKHVKLHLDIQYYEENSCVTEAEIVGFLSVLVDNAIEACYQEGTVYITVYVTKKEVILIVGNEYTPLYGKEIYKMQKNGWSTKGVRRGAGLAGLKKIVEDRYNGKIIISHKYFEEFKERLLLFEVKIENCNQKTTYS